MQYCLAVVKQMLQEGKARKALEAQREDARYIRNETVVRALAQTTAECEVRPCFSIRNENAQETRLAASRLVQHNRTNRTRKVVVAALVQPSCSSAK